MKIIGTGRISSSVTFSLRGLFLEIFVPQVKLKFGAKSSTQGIKNGNIITNGVFGISD